MFLLRNIHVETSSSELPSSPIGVATSTYWYGLGRVYDGSVFSYPKTAAPLGSGFAPTITSITDFNGNSYQQINNTIVRIDTATPIVGSFIADYLGTFLDSSNNHDEWDYDEYSYFSTPKYVSIRSTGRNGGSTINENPIYKLEQNNGYIQITQIITV